MKPGQFYVISVFLWTFGTVPPNATQKIYTHLHGRTSFQIQFHLQKFLVYSIYTTRSATFCFNLQLFYGEGAQILHWVQILQHKTWRWMDMYTVLKFPTLIWNVIDPKLISNSHGNTYAYNSLKVHTHNYCINLFHAITLNVILPFPQGYKCAFQNLTLAT